MSGGILVPPSLVIAMFLPKALQSLPLSVEVHIDYKRAPLVIQRLGDIKRLVEQTLGNSQAYDSEDDRYQRVNPTGDPQRSPIVLLSNKNRPVYVNSMTKASYRKGKLQGGNCCGSE